MTTFELQCPHCQAANEDPFEVVPRGEFDWMICTGCTKKFYFFVAECEACEEETVFTWQVVPEPPWTTSLCCSYCTRRIGISNEAHVKQYIQRS
jgi:hypothetical protein